MIKDPENPSIDEEYSNFFNNDLINSINKEDFSCILYKNHSFIRSFYRDCIESHTPKKNLFSLNDSDKNLEIIKANPSHSNSFLKDFNEKLFPKIDKTKFEKMKSKNNLIKRIFAHKALKSTICGSATERKYSQIDNSKKLKNSKSEANFHSKNAIRPISKILIKNEVLKGNRIAEKIPLKRLSISQRKFKTTFNTFVSQKTKKLNKIPKMLNIRIAKLTRESIRNNSVKIEKRFIENENTTLRKDSPSSKAPIKLLKSEFHKAKVSYVSTPEKKRKEISLKRIKIDNGQVKSRNINNNSLKLENSQTGDNRNGLIRKITSNLSNGSNVFNSIDMDKKSKTYKRITSNELAIIPEIKGMKFSTKTPITNTPNKRNEEKKNIFTMEKSRNIQKKKKTTNIGSLNINVNFQVNFNVINSSEKTNEQNEKILNLMTSSERIENENLFVISETNEKTPRNFQIKEVIQNYQSPTGKRHKFHSKISNLDINFSQSTKNEKFPDKKSFKINNEKKSSTSQSKSKSKVLNNVPSLKKLSNTMSRNKINLKNLLLFSDKNDSKVITSTIIDIDKTFSKKNETEKSSLHNKTMDSIKHRLRNPNLNKTASKLNKNELTKVIKEKNLIKANKGKDLSITTKFSSVKFFNYNTVTPLNTNNKVKIEFKNLKETPTGKPRIECFKSKTTSNKK